MLAEGEFEREARRILPRLAAHGACIRATGEGFGLFTARNRYRKPVAAISGAVMRRFLSRELLQPSQAGEGACGAPDEVAWRLSDVGHSLVRRLTAQGDDPYAAQHRLMTSRLVIPDDGPARQATVNDGESPIGWLRSRKGPDGRPLLGDAAWAAAEQLREDFTFARLSPRITTDWRRTAGTAPKRRSGETGLALSDAAFAARERVRKAFDAVGPGLADVLLQVCCHLKGLEQAERDLNWPRRSGKLVLSIALERLAIHYGLTGTEQRINKRRRDKGAVR